MKLKARRPDIEGGGGLGWWAIDVGRGNLAGVRNEWRLLAGVLDDYERLECSSAPAQACE